jgi:hypothetical protein
VTRLGARAEYRFASPAPRTGTEAAAADDPQLDDYLHTFMANRGVLLTPFHNMALMCPATTAADVDLHTELFEAAVRQLHLTGSRAGPGTTQWAWSNGQRDLVLWAPVVTVAGSAVPVAVAAGQVA